MLYLEAWMFLYTSTGGVDKGRTKVNVDAVLSSAMWSLPPSRCPLLLSLIRLCRLVLAAQLLACSDYECERAIRTMELLKLRFGEPVLHACIVSSNLYCLLGPGMTAYLVGSDSPPRWCSLLLSSCR